MATTLKSDSIAATAFVQESGLQFQFQRRLLCQIIFYAKKKTKILHRIEAEQYELAAEINDPERQSNL